MKRSQVLSIMSEGNNKKLKKKCKQSDDLQSFLTSLHKSSSPLWTLITTYVRETEDIIKYVKTDSTFGQRIHWDYRIVNDAQWQSVIRYAPSLAFCALDQDRFLAPDVITTLSGCGYDSILQSIRLKYNLTSENARVCGNLPLRLAALYGYIAVLKELQTGYGLTIEDARANDNEALRFAAQNNHVGVLKELRTGYGLTIMMQEQMTTKL